MQTRVGVEEVGAKLLNEGEDILCIHSVSHFATRYKFFEKTYQVLKRGYWNVEPISTNWLSENSLLASLSEGPDHPVRQP